MLDSIPFIASGLVLAVIGLLALVQFSGGQNAGLHRVAPDPEVFHARGRELAATLNAALISLLSLGVVGAVAAILIAAVLA